MNFQNYIDFANGNPVCFLATQDGNQPRVRAMFFCFADETGFYLQSGTMKNLYTQIKRNPNIELCFYNPEEGNKMMRVSGKAEFVDDLKIRTKVLDDRPFLKPHIKTADNSEFIVFRIAHGSTHFWTMENNLLPKETIDF